MEHCLWENSFICLNILTQTQQPAEQDNCRISTDGEVFPVGPYLCWCNGARCQHVVGAIGCSKLWQFIRLYQISKSQVDHQCHSFCFTGRAPASSHHWWGPNISPSRFRADGTSLECYCRHHHTASPSSQLTLWGASSHLTEKIRQIACCGKFIPVSKCTFQMVGSHLLPDSSPPGQKNSTPQCWCPTSASPKWEQHFETPSSSWKKLETAIKWGKTHLPTKLARFLWENYKLFFFVEDCQKGDFSHNLFSFMGNAGVAASSILKLLGF